MRVSPFANKFPAEAARDMVVLPLDTEDRAFEAWEEPFFVIMEYYCIEPVCDCRRVLLEALAPGSPADSAPFASILFGWEQPGFYLPWCQRHQPQVALLMNHGFLRDDIGYPCPDLPEVILDYCQRQVFSKPKFVAGFKRHYEMIRKRVAQELVLKQSRTPAKSCHPRRGRVGKKRGGERGID